MKNGKYRPDAVVENGREQQGVQRGGGETTEEYLIHLTLFEEEVQYMMDFIAKHPQATEEELKQTVNQKTVEVAKKLGMTGAERDRYRG